MRTHHSDIALLNRARQGDGDTLDLSGGFHAHYQAFNGLSVRSLKERERERDNVEKVSAALSNEAVAHGSMCFVFVSFIASPSKA